MHVWLYVLTKHCNDENVNAGRAHLRDGQYLVYPSQSKSLKYHKPCSPAVSRAEL